MDKVKVNTRQCIALAKFIRTSGGVPRDVEDPMPYSFPSLVEQNAWCALVAINQQTTPVVGKALEGTVRGKRFRGWDYLLQKAIFESLQDSEMFTVGWLRDVSADDLRRVYNDEELGDTLNHAEDRAFLLRDLGSLLKDRGMASIEEIYEQSEGYIIRSDGLGIDQLLYNARAYQDPVKKKLFYFLAIMRNQGFWEYQDSFNLSAPVNYHEQRGHLRLELVTIQDEELKRKVLARENISEQEDIEIRFAVRHSIEFVARYLEVSPSMMHYYFWNHIRNCCSRDNPHCNGCGDSCTLPKRYRIEETNGCIFASICPSANISTELKFIEPRIDDTLWQ